MKLLFLILSLYFTTSAAQADVIASLNDSRIEEVHWTIRNRFGVTLESKTRVQYFTYTKDNGDKIELPYKIHADLYDQRPIMKKISQWGEMKHPILKKVVESLAGCVYLDLVI